MNDTTEKHLDRQLQEIPLELTPNRDLWPDIQASIHSEYTKNRSSRFERFYPLAAAAVLVIFISSGLNHVNQSGVTVPVTGELIAGNVVESQNTDIPDYGSGLLISAGYKQVRNVLVEDLVSRLETLSPEEKTVIETNMARIDAALAEINAALKSDPDNMLLQRLLMSAYSDDLALFGEINSMTRKLDERIQL